tara:strand:+ start:2259 stop:2459 length:201 start_codon:yes stop_codon:yes gene_type:complete
MKVGDLVKYIHTNDMGLIIRMETKPALPTDREWVYVAWIGTASKLGVPMPSSLSGYPKHALEVVCK